MFITRSMMSFGKNFYPKIRQNLIWNVTNFWRSFWACCKDIIMIHRNETIMHGKQHNIVIKGKFTGVKDTVLHLDYTYQHVVLGKLFNHFLLRLPHLRKVDDNFRLCHRVWWALGEMIHQRLLGEGLACSRCSVSTSSSLRYSSTRLGVAHSDLPESH